MKLAEAVIDQDTALLHQAQLLENKAGHPAVHKFGGSSLRCATAINQVVNIIEQNCFANDMVILSAMGKTTDLLLALIAQSQSRQKKNTPAPDFSKVVDYQQDIIRELLQPAQAQLLLSELHNDIQRIEFLLSRQSSDLPFNPADVVGFGELWSTRIICAVLSLRNIANCRVDSRDFVYIADKSTAVNDDEITPCQAPQSQDTHIDWDKSQQLFIRCRQEFSGCLAVISGYIASDHEGNTVTLGRNGSDFSATIVAKLTCAKMVYLWTDVNGVFSADPNQFNHTSVVPLLGLNEASALASLGTSVFHEKTLKPLQDANIPIRIRNAQVGVMGDPGTLILTHPVKWQGAKTIALKESVCLFRIKWDNGEQHDVLNAKLKSIFGQKVISTYCWLNQHGILGFCVPESCQTAVAKILTQQQIGEGCQFSVHKDLSIISLVGYELLQHGEHLVAYFSLIEQSNKAVLLHHYDENGAISVVIDDKHPVKLVSAIHQAIFAKGVTELVKKTEQNEIGLVFCGNGNIAKKLIEILALQLDKLNQRSSNKLKVIALSNSRHYVFDRHGLDLNNVQQALTQSRLCSRDIEQDLQKLDNCQLAVIDLTASDVVAGQYQQHFSQGRHIISANKLGLTVATAQYQQITQLARDNNAQWLSNVTCGAGLPIQQSIADLCLSGDKLISIEGVFSGSLSWILNQFDGNKPFSQVVAQAKALGLTEPEPRDDLSGKDVQRKLLIVARTMGLTLDLEQIQLSGLIPHQYLSLSAQQFEQSSSELDLHMQQKWQQANAQGLKLCYAGELIFKQVDGETQLSEARVGLSFRESTDAMVGISAADNIAVIRSDWHDDNPLIIRGPGAGINVTAAGIVADLAKLAR